MKFYESAVPDLDKPLMIAAMPDMGNVGGIVIDFINRQTKSISFRIARTAYPDYVINDNGSIHTPREQWVYRHSEGLITFGGTGAQPRDGSELHSMCHDVIETARRHSVAFIYTVGGFHTEKPISPPLTLVAATTPDLTEQVQKAGFASHKGISIIRGFNGIILGYAKAANIRGLGLYGKLNDPTRPQYRAAKSIIDTLERLTFRKFGDTSRLDALSGQHRKDMG